jgi:hypothetical protein
MYERGPTHGLFASERVPDATVEGSGCRHVLCEEYYALSATSAKGGWVAPPRFWGLL